ncbi:UDP-2,3-diacylglucosamine diphosphatase [Alcanivorax sp. 1008]|uniref:UDP-2,3-diacylglucosamine diphosphatase n=1 Tax=Alcanivorax sp. 1008 TaxID=2816853 RepID=UPI001DFA31D6|nr:UDP-2,3-diacylglucosamine diphosphatase [Alcanivorax sp. 1008]MCC1497901.1 UDP-2,3-diacylglucosamine diphosphatase [Alcanivorax sp. 1008]
MSYTLFISDLHLDSTRPRHLNALDALITEHAGKAEALYVLGDLFETWIGDDDDAEFNLSAEAIFRRFSDAGGKLYFMHGNRDFMLGEQFAQRCGGALLAEGTVVDLYGRPTLLLHGDSLCTMDEKYQQFRAMVRNEAWQKDMLAKPLQERRMIAQFMRMQSQQGNANKADNIMDVTPAEVLRVLDEAAVKDMIHGHTHRPAVHDIETASGPGKRYVLGDWNDTLWFIIADHQGNNLIESPIGELQ